MPDEVPEGWNQATIGQVAAPGKYSCVGGPFGSDLTSDDYVPNGVPVIRGGNLSAGAAGFRADGFVYVSEEKADQLSRNLAYPGDLVMTQRGTLGQVALIPDDCPFPRLVVSQSQMKVTLDATRIIRAFAYQYMTSGIALKELENRTIATGVPHINLGILKSFPLLLPPLHEQRKIAAILASVDEAILATQSVIDQTRRVKEGLLQDLLTRGIGNTRFKQTEIGAIPASWALRPFGSLAVLGPQNGLYKSAEFYGAGTQMLDMGEMFASDVFRDRERRRLRLTPKEQQTFQLRAGDLLFARRSLVASGSAKCSITGPMTEYPVFESSIIRFRLDCDTCAPSFYGHFWNSPTGQKLRMGITRQVAVSGVTGKDLARIEVPVPPLTEQREVANHLDDIEARLAAATGFVEQGQAIKAGLLQDLLTGRVRVAA